MIHGRVLVKKSIALAAAAFGAGFLVVAIPSVALAVTDSKVGTVSYFGPVNGVNYKDYNKIGTSTAARAGTFVGKDGTGTLPTQYMAVNARLFKGTTLCKQTGLVYNGVAANSLYEETSSPSCGTGTYHSDGWSYQYYSTGTYNEHNTLVSPDLVL